MPIQLQVCVLIQKLTLQGITKDLTTYQSVAALTLSNRVIHNVTVTIVNIFAALQVAIHDQSPMT